MQNSGKIEQTQKIVQNANLLSLQDYLELRHGPAIAQVLIDDLVTIEDVRAAA